MRQFEFDQTLRVEGNEAAAGQPRRDTDPSRLQRSKEQPLLPPQKRGGMQVCRPGPSKPSVNTDMEK